MWHQSFHAAKRMWRSIFAKMWLYHFNQTHTKENASWYLVRKISPGFIWLWDLLNRLSPSQHISCAALTKLNVTEKNKKQSLVIVQHIFLQQEHRHKLIYKTVTTQSSSQNGIIVFNNFTTRYKLGPPFRRPCEVQHKRAKVRFVGFDWLRFPNLHS